MSSIIKVTGIARHWGLKLTYRVSLLILVPGLSVGFILYFMAGCGLMLHHFSMVSAEMVALARSAGACILRLCLEGKIMSVSTTFASRSIIVTFVGFVPRN